MTRDHPYISRRNALQTVAGVTLASVAGCLNNGGSSGTPGDGTTAPDSQGPLKRVAVEGTTLVVELSAEADINQVNLIQPNGELFGKRDVATGVHQVSFEIGTAYALGEYRVVALKGEEAVAESTTDIEPKLQIQDVGLYRNNPDKPWDEVYGDTETDRLKNGEAFVTVTNAGTGPDAIVELVFSGDVPNPIEDPRGSGMYDTEQVAKAFDVEYSGSDEMSDCEVTITEA